jgi:hypothetical protein
MSRIVKRIMHAAGLRPELTFRSFRHGGLTEMGDAELTDSQIRAQSRHRSSKVLPHYVKRTMKQIVDGAKRRPRCAGGTNMSRSKKSKRATGLTRRPHFPRPPRPAQLRPITAMPFQAGLHLLSRGAGSPRGTKRHNLSQWSAPLLSQ